MTQYGEHSIASVIEGYLGEVLPRYEAGGVEYIGRPTGFAKVDDLTGGMSADELWIIASRQGMGKSALTLQLAMQHHQDDKTTLLFSLEMSAHMLVNRMLSSLSGVAAGRIVRGKLEEDEWKRVLWAANDLRNYNFVIYDQTMNSEQVMEATMQHSNVGLTIVDYAGILTDQNSHGEVERLTQISSNMKQLSRVDHSNAPVILVAQLNRQSEQNEGSRPVLSNIKGSDAFGADASVVLFPFRPHYFKLMRGEKPLDVEDAEIIVAKNRNGPMATTKARFHPRQMRWEQ